MSELQGLLDREARRVSAETGALDIVMRRVERRRRNRRATTAVFALILAAAALGTLVKAFERSQPRPARWPRITIQNVARLQMAWTAKEPGGCCPTATVSGDRVYVGGSKGLSAYPTQCGTGGIRCAPLWFGAVDHLRHYMLAPVAADDMVFVVDGKSLYAFSTDCATGGATCGPSWIASQHGTVELSPPAVGDGLVFISWGTHVYAYPEHCGTGGSTCDPVWVGHGEGPPSVIDGIVYGSECTLIGRPCAANSRHRVYAWSAECIAQGGACDPLWFGLVRGLLPFPSAPVVANDLVYFGAGNRVYAFPVGCATGGARCEPVWIGATEQPGGGRVQSWAITDGMVFAGTTGRRGLYSGSPGDMYAFSVDCGSAVCHPVWSVHLDGDPWLTARNGVLFVGTYGGSFFAYPTRCAPVGGTCAPLWHTKTFDGGLIFDHVTMTDSTICAGGDSGQAYCFAIPRND
jgi:hypothetical protein